MTSVCAWGALKVLLVLSSRTESASHRGASLGLMRLAVGHLPTANLVETMADLLPRLPRIEALIGRRLGEIDAATIERMVTTHVREDTDLDFKVEIYKDADKGHQDAAADVAAMANGPGGAIFLGIRDQDGAAVEVVPVAFSEMTELRLRQAIISLSAPAPLFVLHRVPVTAALDRGVYLVVVPPSPYAPHAVRSGVRLGYPRRSGPHTRWLSESEVAESYRSRFISGEQRAERLDVVRNDGAEMLGEAQIWVATALVPVVPGSFTVRRRSMVDLQNAALGWYRQDYANHVFVGQPQAEAAVGRVVIYSDRKEGSRRSTSGHAELYTDGSAFAATPVGGRQPASTVSYVEDEWMVEAAIATAAFCIEFAIERAGAVGDAYINTSVIASPVVELELAHTRMMGTRTTFAGSHRVSGGHVSRALISLEDAATPAGGLVVARMLLSEVFQWFGYPEVPQITEEGRLRRRYIANQNKKLVETWAAANGVEMVDTVLEVEP